MRTMRKVLIIAALMSLALSSGSFAQYQSRTAKMSLVPLSECIRAFENGIPFDTPNRKFYRGALYFFEVDIIDFSDVVFVCAALKTEKTLPQLPY